MNAGITLHIQNHLRRQQSPYIRDLLQGRGPGAENGNGDRSAPGWPHSLDQGNAGLMLPRQPSRTVLQETDSNHEKLSRSDPARCGPDRNHRNTLILRDGFCMARAVRAAAGSGCCAKRLWLVALVGVIFYLRAPASTSPNNTGSQFSLAGGLARLCVLSLLDWRWKADIIAQAQALEPQAAGQIDARHRRTSGLERLPKRFTSPAKTATEPEKQPMPASPECRRNCPPPAKAIASSNAVASGPDRPGMEDADARRHHRLWLRQPALSRQGFRARRA